ncbi:hypothetical protein BCD64_00145 [Nostoc sp. MBR 210]|nr:hypothetical protein BCD64_00145 [Nostoc sp. MBR 210]
MNKILTKIQSRLSRRGLKISLGTIREKYLSLEILDYDNPTDDELSSVVDYFIQSSSLPIPVEQLETEDFGLEISSNDEAMPSGQANANTITTNDYTDNTELVRTTAQSLGIVLDTQEISDIATNVNNSSDDLHDSLDDIKSAIITFVKYKSSLNSQRINQVVEEINDVVTDEFNSNSRQLTHGLQAISRNMQQQNTDFKRKVNAAISVFKVPTAG